MTDSIVFLGFIVSAQEVSADSENLGNCRMAGAPNYLGSEEFHGLATFYRRFIKGFSTIMAPVTDCLKREEFQWSIALAKAFQEIKQRMTEAPIMKLPDFSKVFEVMCDTLGIGVGGILSQQKHRIAFFSEN